MLDCGHLSWHAARGCRELASYLLLALARVGGREGLSLLRLLLLGGLQPSRGAVSGLLRRRARAWAAVRPQLTMLLPLGQKRGRNWREEAPSTCGSRVHWRRTSFQLWRRSLPFPSPSRWCSVEPYGEARSPQAAGALPAALLSALHGGCMGASPSGLKAAGVQLARCPLRPQRGAQW